MKTINNEVFLNKITQRINAGDFDVYFTLPFMSKNLLLSCIKERLNKKITTGGTPILSDADIKDCIAEVKETAVNIISIYIKLGFIIRTENGFEFTEKMNLGIKAAYKS
jgi:hypothetical protein